MLRHRGPTIGKIGRAWGGRIRTTMRARWLCTSRDERSETEVPTTVRRRRTCLCYRCISSLATLANLSSKPGFMLIQYLVFTEATKLCDLYDLRLLRPLRLTTLTTHDSYDPRLSRLSRPSHDEAIATCLRLITPIPDTLCTGRKVGDTYNVKAVE